MEFNVVSDKRGSAVEGVCDIAESRISELDKMLSIFDDSSVVSKINNDPKKTVVRVPPDLFRLVKDAKEFFVLTDGAFDITVEPFTEIWGFGPAEKRVPDAQAISDILVYVGLDKVGLDDGERLIFKDPRIRIDFGGLAKGHAVDEAVKIFKRHGITDGLINMGGDLYCMGVNPDGNDWSIGIKDPEAKHKVLSVLNIRDKAIATSGTYENFYIYNDSSYTHIIDPRTGYTVTNDILSATIIADDCRTADALATAVFVLGKDKGLALIEKLPGAECYMVIEKDGIKEHILSSGMGSYLRDEA
jgi:thiamine biosynthesis lipoprotein